MMDILGFLVFSAVLILAAHCVVLSTQHVFNYFHLKIINNQIEKINSGDNSNTGTLISLAFIPIVVAISFIFDAITMWHLQ